MSTIPDHDDALLDALSTGGKVPQEDDLALLLEAWRNDIDAEPAPFLVRDAAPAVTAPLPIVKRWRAARPLLVGGVASVLAFGGLAAASATAEPGTPLWPITRIIFGDRAESQLAEQEAQRLLEQARAALANGQLTETVALVESAYQQIQLVKDPSARQRLEAEATAILTQIYQRAEPEATPTLPPPPTTAPNGSTPTIPPTATPSPSQPGLLPPLPPLPSILRSLLPSPLLPSLPLLG